MAIRISEAVGEGGRNNRGDVWNVQTLLIKVRKSQSQPPIQLDGAIGPETIGAIRTFQKDQFGWPTPDGRIDVGGTTLRHLNLLTDTSGASKFLLEPVITKRRGNRELKIGADGQIIVSPGDWLSKYSFIVDGDFRTIWTYMRLNDDGQFVEIANRNLIRAGESLYHIPTFLEFRKRNDLPPVPVPTPRKPTKEEEKKINEEFLARDYNLRGDHAKALSTGLTYLERGEAAASVIETIAAIWVESVVLGAIATTLSIVGAFASILANTIALINAHETMQKMAGMRAAVYATVAWAFDHKSPPFSREMERRLRQGQNGPLEIDRCRRAWNDAARSAVSDLEKSALGPTGRSASKKVQDVLIAAGKERLKIVGGGDPKALCALLMKNFDAQFDRTVLELWRMGYDMQNHRSSAYLYDE